MWNVQIRWPQITMTDIMPVPSTAVSMIEPATYAKYALSSRSLTTSGACPAMKLIIEVGLQERTVQPEWQPSEVRKGILVSLVETPMRCLAVTTVWNPSSQCDDRQTSRRRLFGGDVTGRWQRTRGLHQGRKRWYFPALGKFFTSAFRRKVILKRTRCTKNFFTRAEIVTFYALDARFP